MLLPYGSQPNTPDGLSILKNLAKKKLQITNIFGKSSQSESTYNPEEIEDENADTIPEISLSTTSSQVMAITGESTNSTLPKMSLSTTSSQVMAITGESTNSTLPKMSLGTVSTQIMAITGESTNSTLPKINLSETSSQIKVITGEGDDMTAPKINLSEVSGQIKVITGEGDDMTAPKINLSEVSGQIVAITGEGDDMSAPKINLSDVFAALDELISGPPAGRTELADIPTSLTNTKTHVDSNLTTAGNSAHGLSAFTSTAPQSLGTAYVGASNSPSRSDHVHPKPTYTPADIGITMGGTPAALADSASAGSGTAVALSNHVHVKPSYTPADIGITMGGTPAALAASANAGSGTAVALSNHVHVKPSYTPADIGITMGGTPAALAASASAGSGTAVALSNHVHVKPSYTIDEANSAGLMGGTWFPATSYFVHQSKTQFNDSLSMGNTSWGGAYLGLAPSVADSTNAIYGFVGDTDTGMTRISDGVIGFMSNGSVYAKLNASAQFVPGIVGTGQIGNNSNRWIYGYFEDITSRRAVYVDSDIRIKKDITGSDLGLDFILSLHPVKYRLKLETDLNNPFHYGFIAQELKGLLVDPEKGFAGYKYDEKEDSYSIGYTEFIAPIITAMQEEHKTVLSLEKRIADLEAIILELRNK